MGTVLSLQNQIKIRSEFVFIQRNVVLTLKWKACSLEVLKHLSTEMHQVHDEILHELAHTCVTDNVLLFSANYCEEYSKNDYSESASARQRALIAKLDVGKNNTTTNGTTYDYPITGIGTDTGSQGLHEKGTVIFTFQTPIFLQPKQRQHVQEDSSSQRTCPRFVPNSLLSLGKGQDIIG